jgi:hypothetical protein
MSRNVAGIPATFHPRDPHPNAFIGRALKAWVTRPDVLKRGSAPSGPKTTSRGSQAMKRRKTGSPGDISGAAFLVSLGVIGASIGPNPTGTEVLGAFILATLVAVLAFYITKRVQQSRGPQTSDGAPSQPQVASETNPGSRSPDTASTHGMSRSKLRRWVLAATSLLALIGLSAGAVALTVNSHHPTPSVHPPVSSLSSTAGSSTFIPGVITDARQCPQLRSIALKAELAMHRVGGNRTLGLTASQASAEFRRSAIRVAVLKVQLASIEPAPGLASSYRYIRQGVQEAKQTLEFYADALEGASIHSPISPRTLWSEAAALLNRGQKSLPNFCL